MATTEFNVCERTNPVKLAKKAVTQRVSHQEPNSSLPMPIKVLPTRIKSRACMAQMHIR